MRFPTILCAGLASSLMLAGCAAESARTPASGTPSDARSGLVTARGQPLTLVGTPASVGQPAPGFTAVAIDMSETSLAAYRGKTVILSTVPSLDTAVCDKETRIFNERAASLPQDIVILTVSMDLPFAQKRWCGAAGIDRVITLSDSKRREVGDRYGLRIRESGLLARSVTVIDPQGIILYQQIVPELTAEPDYDSALAAAEGL